MEQTYIDILVEAVGDTTVWAFTTQMTYFATLAFGKGNLVLATLMAWLGGSIGCFINYGIGRLLARCQDNGLSKIPAEKYALWRGRFFYMMPFIALASWVHLVGVLVVGLGFLRISARYTLPALMAGQALYYFYHHAQATGL